MKIAFQILKEAKKLKRTNNEIKELVDIYENNNNSGFYRTAYVHDIKCSIEEIEQSIARIEHSLGELESEYKKSKNFLKNYEKF